MNIARPPSLGMEWLCIFLSPGKSIAPTFLAIDLTRGVSKKEKPEAKRKRMRYLSISLGY
jgi:hypothetical protein